MATIKSKRVGGRWTWRLSFGSSALALAVAAACGGQDQGGIPQSQAGAPSNHAGDASSHAGDAPRPLNEGGDDSDSASTGGVAAGGAPASASGSGGRTGGTDGGHADGGYADGGSGEINDGGADGSSGNGSSGNGSGGSSGNGGLAGGGGSGVGPPLSPGTGLGSMGRACAGPNDCAPNLICITERHLSLAGAAPPHGFCSAPCVDDQACTQRSPGAVCYPFAEGDNGSFCVEGCSFGTPDIGQAKCHDRVDFACNPALTAPTQASCQITSDCASDELCVNGACNWVLPACLPACRGDLDCAPGLYCDQSFLAGTCTPTKPTGKRLGEPCTLPSAEQPAEPDECLGFCQADSDTGTSGHCGTTCSLGNACAWDASSQKFDGACFYASSLTTESGDFGDFGFCTPACSCGAACKDSTLACLLLGNQPLSPEFSGPGLCFSPDASAELACP